MVTRSFSGLILFGLLFFCVAFQACDVEEEEVSAALKVDPAPEARFEQESEVGTGQVTEQGGNEQLETTSEDVSFVQDIGDEIQEWEGEESVYVSEQNTPVVESLHATVGSFPEENSTVESLHEENNSTIQSDVDAKEEAKPLRTPPVGLDEYKRGKVLETALTKREENFTMHHKRELGGEEYNFASASHGAKVVSTNKEAKGGGNVLNKDSDKYMRNPCSSEEKFIVVELSEEAQVDTVVIENKELYSSNPKEFEVLGSLVYPTDEWKSLGKLEAENVRHSQRFDLPDPQWVKYLKVNLLSHYGTEFYCTLTTMEAYGIDAIERLLVDWIGKTPHASEGHQPDVPSSPVNDAESVERKPVVEVIPESYMQGTRSNIDSVIKLLMQKVKKMEHEQTVFDNYLETLNSDYKNIFAEHEREIKELNHQLKESNRIKDALLESLQKLEQQRKELNRQLDDHIEMESLTWTSLSQRLSRMADRELLAFSLALLTLIWTIASHCSRKTWFLTTLALLVLILST